MASYRVRPGRKFGARKQYSAGDLVELDPAQVVGFEDKLELVDVEVKAEAKAEAEAEAPKAEKAKAKA
jgi:hypothetical protein